MLHRPSNIEASRTRNIPLPRNIVLRSAFDAFFSYRAAAIYGVAAVQMTFRSLTLISAASVGLAGCTLGPDFMQPPPPAVMGYTAAPLPPETASADTIAGDAQRFLQDADVPGQWWALFGNPALNGLVEQALKANPDIEA